MTFKRVYLFNQSEKLVVYIVYETVIDFHYLLSNGSISIYQRGVIK